jgi:hypothetical protein
MKKISILTLLLSAVSINANACSFAPGYFEFKSEQNFKAKMQNEVIALLPAPKAKIIKIIRGSSSDGGYCGDAGIIMLSVEWPKGSVYSLEEIGFYFQADNGMKPDLIFPLEPIKGTINKNIAVFQFVWLDGHPKYQKPLNFKVNVFAVNKGLQIGQPTQIHIEAKKGSLGTS